MVSLSAAAATFVPQCSGIGFSEQQPGRVAKKTKAHGRGKKKAKSSKAHGHEEAPDVTVHHGHEARTSPDATLSPCHRELLHNLSAAFPQHDRPHLSQILGKAGWDVSRAVDIITRLDDCDDDAAMARRLQHGTDAPEEASSRDRRQQAADMALARRIDSESQRCADVAGDAVLARRLELEGMGAAGRDPTYAAQNGSGGAADDRGSVSRATAGVGAKSAAAKPRRLQGRQYGAAVATATGGARPSISGLGSECQPTPGADRFPAVSFSEIIDVELATRISLLDHTDPGPGSQVRFLSRGGDGPARPPADADALALRPLALATGPSSPFLELQEWYACELAMQRWEEDSDPLSERGRRQQPQSRRGRATDDTVLGSSIHEIDCHGLCVESALEYTKRFIGIHKEAKEIAKRALRRYPIKSVSVITGRGIHSFQGHGKIKEVVKSLLSRLAMPFQEREGSFRIHL